MEYSNAAFQSSTQNSSLEWLTTLNTFGLQWYDKIAGGNKPPAPSMPSNPNLPQASAKPLGATNWTTIAIAGGIGLAIAFGLAMVTKR